MNTQVTRKPAFSAAEALLIAAEGFEVAAVSAEELPSERDQNFRIVDGRGRALVLKISNPDEVAEVIDFQNQALLRLGEGSLRGLVPALHRCPRGGWVFEAESLAGVHMVRLVTFLEGVPWGTARPVAHRLVEEAGELLGRIDAELASFEHPAMGRHLYWDSRHALETIAGNRPYLRDAGRLELLDHFLDSYRERFLPFSGALRESVVHNDANDYNLLVDRREAPSRVAGLIDFGDLVRTFTIFEPANACAYLMMGREDPVETAACAVRGYCRRFTAPAFELSLLGYPIAIRLCLSVSNAARQVAQAPDNEYLAISEGPAWKLLGFLAGLDLAAFGETMIRAGKSGSA